MLRMPILLLVLGLILQMQVVAASSSPAGIRSETAITPAVLPQAEHPAPVVVDGRILFEILTRFNAFTPAERASAITQRLNRLAEEKPGDTSSLMLVDFEGNTEIVAGELVLMVVTDADATATGKSRHVLAQEHLQAMRLALASHSRITSTHGIFLGLLYAGGVTIILLVLLFVLQWFFRKLLTRIASWEGTRIRSLSFKSIEILHQERIVGMLAGGCKTLRTVLVLIILFIYLSLVLSFFPWTKGIAASLLDYVSAPLSHLWHGLLAYIPNIFFIVVIVAATHYFLRFIQILFHEVEKGTLSLPGFHVDWAKPTFNIVRFLVIAFAVVVAFPYLPGSDSPAFKGVSVFLGVLLSLGSTSVVGNIVSGVIITYMRPFKVGDRVKIAETVGDVMEKTLLVTRVRTIKNVDITIPNALVLGSHITNYSSTALESGLILHTTVTIGYDAPWRQVHELLIAAARATETICAQPPPFVLQTSLDDFYVSYELNAFTNQPSAMANTYSLLHQNIQDRFNEAGVEIMSPHYAQLRDGNVSTIPPDFLPPGYVPSGFRLQKEDFSEDRSSGLTERR